MTQRKTDHIALAEKSVPEKNSADQRFYYEPLLNIHPNQSMEFDFLGKKIGHPLWISSMTGGSAQANKINHILAEACAEFKLGMGLGSCRTLLESNQFFDDFNLRPIIGNDLPFYANLGIAQIEELIATNKADKIHEMVEKLKADGLFIHVNPTQEWLQPEGDRFKKPAIETISKLIALVKGNYKIIVKEVGQGFGPESIKEILSLKIDGLEFGAFGGTNFANIEIDRSANSYSEYLKPLATIGHTAQEMLSILNSHIQNEKTDCKQLIISGGLKNFLDGYYLIQKSSLPAVYGMAGAVLKHAINTKDDLFDFIKAEYDGYRFASHFLKIKY